MTQPAMPASESVLLDTESVLLDTESVLLDTESVLLDTDIGSDIDDAVCLAYLLRQPRCRLLGVTTVTGDVQQRAALAKAVCQAAGRDDVPIHAGATGPLLFGPGQPHTPHFEAIADSRPRCDYPRDAIEFLRSTIHAHPGQVTLLSIGPLTNIALLLAADPTVAAKLKRLVLMVGYFFPPEPKVEWNARCDPLATAIAFPLMPAGTRCIGLDVTLQCRMPADAVRQRFAAAGEPLATVLRQAEVWFKKGHPQITFHDPLAAATIFNPALCHWHRGAVQIEVEEHAMAGETRFAADDNGRIEVADKVNADAFFSEYFSVFSPR